MLLRLSKMMMFTAAMASVFSVCVWAQATPAPQKKVKDRAIYCPPDSFANEQSPTKRLEALNAWKEKDPDTDFKKERQLLYLSTYVQLNQPAKAIEAAKSVLEIDPKDTTSLYYISVLTVSQNDTSAGALDSAEKAAQRLIGSLDTTFAKEKKTAATTDAQWAQARTDLEATAHKTLGWVALQKKQYDAAKQELTKELSMNAGDAQASYWLGQALGSSQAGAARKNGLKSSAMLWHYARAASYDGPGALPPDGRKQADDDLQRAYKRWHGGPDGLVELKAQAKTSPAPPTGFKIPTVRKSR